MEDGVLDELPSEAETYETMKMKEPPEPMKPKKEPAEGLLSELAPPVRRAEGRGRRHRSQQQLIALGSAAPCGLRKKRRRLFRRPV